MSNLEKSEIDLEINKLNSEINKKIDLSTVLYLTIKRVIDILVAVIGIIITSPIMLMTSVLIKLETKGPIIFKQVRLGKNGQKFIMYKFRSMIKNAEKDTGATWAKKDDCRVTNIGKFIRKTRIDELPQFINILNGDMTLIGPRPERPCLTNEFHNKYCGFKNRLAVKPGVTGLAQVKGGYEMTPGQKLRFDLLYIKKRNLLLDIEIIIRTIIVIICGSGAR